MGTIQPDTSFARDGRTLGDWLPELVSDDRETRLQAAEALGGMWWGKPYYSTSLTDMDGIADIAHQQKSFAQAVQKAVDSPGFPREVFVRRLILFRVGMNADWLDRVNRMSSSDEIYDKRESELLEISLTHDDPEVRELAAKRYARLFCAGCARDQKLINESESSQPPGMVTHLVFDALDTQLLEASDLLHQMLDINQLRRHALEALCRCGKTARHFANRLLSEIDRGKRVDPHDVAKPLASIGRDDPAIVDQLLERLRCGTKTARMTSAKTLEHMAPYLAGYTDEALEHLLGLSHDPEYTYLVLEPLASVGREHERALDRVLEVLLETKSRWVTYEAYPDHPFDQSACERASAIDALGYFTGFPERAVPALIKAFDLFEEYDPDMTYKGDHEASLLCADGVRFRCGSCGSLAETLSGRLAEEVGV